MGDDIKVEVSCDHNNLRSYDKYTGIVVADLRGDKGPSNLEGMFTYKKYICNDCEKIITVLNAVVEKL